MTKIIGIAMDILILCLSCFWYIIVETMNEDRSLSYVIIKEVVLSLYSDRSI